MVQKLKNYFKVLFSYLLISLFIFLIYYFCLDAQKILAKCIKDNITSIISCVEILLNSLSINSNSNITTNTTSSSLDLNHPEKVEIQILESLISIISILEVLLLKKPNNSQNSHNISDTNDQIDFATLFLSSRLLPVLSSILMKFLSSNDKKPFYLKLNDINRRKYVLEL